MKPFSPRPTFMLEPLTNNGWRLKRYAITYGELPYDERRFSRARELAMRELPQPAVAHDRRGIGFIIEHQGNAIDYLVLGWWDRENELPLRVFVRDGDESAVWRGAVGGESVCVWDLEVIWGERQAYVETVLGTDADDAALDTAVEAYLARDVSPQPARR
jgi:hypothetical protein